MATLAKLLDCLKWPKVAASGRPVGVNPQINLAADPELAFGWQGNLFASFLTTTAQGAATTLASVTIPDDCFYVLDATCDVAGTVAANRRIALEVVDPFNNIAYSLAFGFICSVLTAVGVTNTPPAVITNMRLHLPTNALVRWKNLDALVATDVSVGGLSLRKLYEENI